MDTDRPPEPYLQGTELLRQGRVEEAAARLEVVPEDDRTPEHAFALGRIYLALERGADAHRCFERLRDHPPRDPGARAHLALLVSAALAAAGRREEALQRLEDVTGLDARFERAARALGRRIDGGKRPVCRL